ncbi:MAG: hypothetical protein ACTSO2_09380 [Promethearchaeota archaeon]
MAKKKKKEKEKEKQKNKIKEEALSFIEIMEKKDTSEIVPKLKILHTKEEEQADEIVKEIISEENQTVSAPEKEGAIVKKAPSFLSKLQDIEAKSLSLEGDKPVTPTSSPPPPPSPPPSLSTPVATEQGESATQRADIEVGYEDSTQITEEKDITQLISDEEILKPSIELKSMDIDINVGDYVQPGTLWGNIGIFFKELIQSFNERYDLWEDSINHILSLLKKFEQINRVNSEVLIKTIEKSHKKIEDGLKRFKTKRDFVEKISGIEYTKTISELNKTLTLLQLNLKMIKIKDLLDQFCEIYSK